MPRLTLHLLLTACLAACAPVPEIEASRFAGRAPAPGPAPDLAPPPGPAPATAAPPAPASGAADALRDRARRIAGPVISEDERRRLDEAAARR